MASFYSEAQIEMMNYVVYGDEKALDRAIEAIRTEVNNPRFLNKVIDVDMTTKEFTQIITDQGCFNIREKLPVSKLVRVKLSDSPEDGVMVLNVGNCTGEVSTLVPMEP